MSGAVQLVATGPQDEWLTGKPEMSYFMTNYRRSTHYANSVERLVVQGKPVDGGFSTIKIDKKGDLLSYIYLTTIDPSGATVSQNYWIDSQTIPETSNFNSIIDRVELYIGGQLIDTQDANFLKFVDNPLEARSYNKGKIVTTGAIFPLRFFFCKDWSACIPLVGLAFHEVEIRIHWALTYFLYNNTVQAWANYIYLDEPERKWFACKTYNMLITQTQRTLASTNNWQDLPFANPVKYIAFPAFPYDSIYHNSINMDMYQFKIQINGVDIGESRGLPHWTNVPLYYNVKWGLPVSTDVYPDSEPGLSGLAVISYCLDTASLEPTGTINFSRIDSFRIVAPTKILGFVNGGGINALCYRYTNDVDYLYAVNYNILRIQDGMGSLLYSS